MSTEGVPKKFLIRCNRCKWSEFSTGLTADLKHLKEIPNNCPKCGKIRKFRCPKCGDPSKMMRIGSNK